MLRDDVDWQLEQELESQLYERTTMNTNINDLTFEDLVPSQSKYLAKADVGEGGLVLTIKGFRNEQVDTGDEGIETKMVMHFIEPNVKPMILNRTNSQLISIATGAKTAGEARGKKIIVFNDPTVGFGGKIVGGLRVKKAPGSGKIEDIDNDIPFN